MTLRSVRDTAFRLLQILYHYTLRGYLPMKIGSYNGVAVREVPLLDMHDTSPDYEGPLIQGIRHAISTRDDVCLIGGGLGVSTAVAARRAGPCGSVMTFEASSEQIEKIEETLALNNIGETVTIRHALVGPDISVWGNSDDPERLDLADLPDCDVLVLDCEGAEKELLSSLTDGPATIVVETHAAFDSPTNLVKSFLKDSGYDVTHVGVENEEMGAEILLATTSRSDVCPIQ